MANKETINEDVIYPKRDNDGELRPKKDDDGELRQKRDEDRELLSKKDYNEDPFPKIPSDISGVGDVIRDFYEEKAKTLVSNLNKFGTPQKGN